jgi:hypothetical protein
MAERVRTRIGSGTIEALNVPGRFPNTLPFPERA